MQQLPWEQVQVLEQVQAQWPLVAQLQLWLRSLLLQQRPWPYAQETEVQSLMLAQQQLMLLLQEMEGQIHQERLQPMQPRDVPLLPQWLQAVASKGLQT